VVWGGNTPGRFHAGVVGVAPATPYSYITTGPQAVRFDSTYCYHAFTGSVINGFAPRTGFVLPSTIDVFIVAGGGRGQNPGSGAAGGGAGGEAKHVYGHTAPTTARTVNVGSGGDSVNQDGTNSVFDGITSTRGRAGGSVTTGVGGVNNLFGGGTANGNAGGGGAGTAGAGQNAPSSSQGGDGGPGITNDWFDGTTRTYGRGGGGGSASSGVTGGTPVGVTPERGGGGGAVVLDSAFAAINGQPGVIIIRYLRQY
jgi:hypothetical protein